MKSVLACVFAAVLVACSGSGNAVAPTVTLDASVRTTAPLPTDAPVPTVSPAAAPTTPSTGRSRLETMDDEAGEEEDDSVAAASSPQVGVPDSTDVIADDFISFSTPSGNISCIISEDTFCRISDKDWEIDRPADCQDDYGNVVIVASSGPLFGCYTDLFWDPDAEPLGYGSTATVGQMTCSIERTGVTCENGDDQGFRIARAAVQLF